MADVTRRGLLELSSLPLLLSAGCLEFFSRDDTVTVSNESDRKHALTVQFEETNADSVVSEREMKLQPGAEREYTVHLADAGHESSHYVVTVTTKSGLRKEYDLSEGVFFTMDVTVTADGVEVSHTIR